MILEPTERPWPRWQTITAAFDRELLANAAISWLFAITGPLAILVAVGSKAGLSQADIASWIFGAYGLGGVFSIVMSYLYRQPLGIAWSIPAAILAGPALVYLSFAEVVGAYIGAGVLMVVLGVTGWASKVMKLLPMPIVMGMVSGVFLPFCLKIIGGLEADFWVALPTVVAFFLASSVPRIGRVVPPVLAALVAGVAVIILSGQFVQTGPLSLELVRPKLVEPAFTVRAYVELVLPLMVTVIGIHNPQGFAVLAAAKYRPPINASTLCCGLGSLLMASVGSSPTCVAGPANAIMCSSGRTEQRFVAGMIFGVLMLAFGLAAPLATQLSLGLPAAFIGVLGGLAMIGALQSWLTNAFAGELSFGALVAFLVALSEINIFHIGAPFWALAAGVAASWLVERAALRRAWDL